MDLTYHYILGGFLILLMGIDFLTTEYAFKKFGTGVKEVNPFPVMKKIAGNPLWHFSIKAPVVGLVVGWDLIFPHTKFNYSLSITILYVLCIVVGVVQINNLRVIFEEET